ncbi:hypothetical protein MSP7336_04110 [Mycobacterium shimoidei]|uniref:DUF5642 domain-containing protein n=2 Tax=Mycobacterium shimoidei TaxID=29313 RepID=A0A375Z416_MYCSH|nr:DUF5642 family protein [Mycobacterium shimoidei]SRX95837.1 hypothetical protein MSP7336_04110 [Mycobacterium shimoidei]
MLAVAGLGSVALAACVEAPEHTAAHSAQPPAPSSAQPAPPPPKYDISRVDNLKDSFPPGFKTDPHPAKTLEQQDIDNSGIMPFTQAQFDPPQCRALVIPPYVDATVGTQAAGVRGQADQGEIYIVAMRLTKPTPAGPPPAGCEQVSMSGASQATGTAEAIPAPNIEGATTTGVKLSPADTDEDPDYEFTVALDDQTSIVVMGSTAEQLNPQQVMSDLLVKAASAVRGQ